MGLFFDWVSTMAAIGVAGLSALYYFQGNLLFFPTRGEEYTPSQFQLPFEDLAATSADGTRIHGWIIKQQDAKNRPVRPRHAPSPASAPAHHAHLDRRLSLRTATQATCRTG